MCKVLFLPSCCSTWSDVEFGNPSHLFVAWPNSLFSGKLGPGCSRMDVALSDRLSGRFGGHFCMFGAGFLWSTSLDSAEAYGLCWSLWTILVNPWQTSKNRAYSNLCPSACGRWFSIQPPTSFLFPKHQKHPIVKKFFFYHVELYWLHTIESFESVWSTPKHTSFPDITRLVVWNIFLFSHIYWE